MSDTPSAASTQPPEPKPASAEEGEDSLQTEMIQKLDAIIEAFSKHPDARQEHIEGGDQAPSKRNPIEYLHEFADKTKALVLAIDPTVPRSQDPNWVDALGRCHFLNLIVNDTTGKAAMMFGFPPDTVLEFSDDIKAKAHALSLRASKNK